MFIVLYRRKHMLGGLRTCAYNETFTDLEKAEKAANECREHFKCIAWIVEADEPNLRPPLKPVE